MKYTSAPLFLAATLAGNAALGVTPEELWAHWQETATNRGVSLSAASEARDGDRLVVSDAIFGAEDDGTTIAVTFGTITLEDIGGGAVEITLEDSYPIIFRDDDAEIALDVRQKDARLVASGERAAISYDLSYAELALSLARVVILDDNGEKTPDASAEVTLTGVKGTYEITAADNGNSEYASSVGAEGATFDLAANDDESDGGVTIHVTMSDLASTTTGTTVPLADMDDIGEALAAGFAISSESSSGPTSITFEFTDDGDVTEFIGDFGGSASGITLSASEFDYNFGLTEGKLSLAAPGLAPIPFDGSFDEVTFGLGATTASDDEAGTFSLLARLQNIAISDSIWDMIDPTGQFPHDAASLVLDLGATGGWTPDLLEDAAEFDDVEPGDLLGQLHSLTLASAFLQAVGVEATATGAFTFDGTDTMTFGGIPAPEGKLTASLSGVQGLISTLSDMGLLGPDELFAVNIGLAEFAVPGAGEDTFSSEVEFRDGHLFVNGQQLQ